MGMEDRRFDPSFSTAMGLTCRFRNRLGRLFLTPKRVGAREIVRLNPKCIHSLIVT